MGKILDYLTYLLYYRILGGIIFEVKGTTLVIKTRKIQFYLNFTEGQKAVQIVSKNMQALQDYIEIIENYCASPFVHFKKSNLEELFSCIISQIISAEPCSDLGDMFKLVFKNEGIKGEIGESLRFSKKFILDGANRYAPKFITSFLVLPSRVYLSITFEDELAFVTIVEGSETGDFRWVLNKVKNLCFLNDI